MSLAKIFESLLSALLFAAVLIAGILEYLTLTEYKPGDRESVSVNPIYTDPVKEGDTLKVLTWNCGYGALGDNADYYADGGKGVFTADKERIYENLSGIVEAAEQTDPDVIFFQEVDRDASRSRHIEEAIEISNALLDEEMDMKYTTGYACNYDVGFIPFPVPPLGKVRSGIMTLTDFKAESARRISLPDSYKWPARLTGHKRCLLTEHIPLQNSDKYLVLINLQLEEYAGAEEKAAQVRALAQILREEAVNGNYVIAGGDFDGAFSSADVSAYAKADDEGEQEVISAEDFGPDWQCLMDSSVPTKRSLERPYAGADRDTFKYSMTDGFIVSSNVEVRSLETKDLGFVNTDHNPVLMECVLR